MSSLERLPSDEIDETQLNPASELQEKGTFIHFLKFKIKKISINI